MAEFYLAVTIKTKTAMKTTQYHPPGTRTGTWWAAAALTALVALGACKKDDPEPSTHDLLIGSWEMIEAEVEGIKVKPPDVRFEAEFQSDGDYKETVFYGGVSETYFGSWSLSGNEIELEYDDGEEWELTILSINNDQLKVTDHDEFEGLFKRDK